MTDKHTGSALSAPPAPAPAAVAAAAAAAGPVERALTVTEPNGSAHLRVKLPAAWTADAISIVLRDEYQEAIAGVQFTVICNASCGDDELTRAPKVLAQMFENKARPNVNTGDPAMDAVRLKVEVVDHADLADGTFQAARVTKPPGLEGPYREQVYAACVRVKKGSKTVAAQGWAPVEREGELGPVIVAACKTFEIL